LSTLARAWRYPQTRIGALITLSVILLALVGPALAPHSPTQFVAAPFSPPSGVTLLGADELGRDVLSRVLCGGRGVLWMSLAATVAGVAFGIGVGLVAGYTGGRTDALLMRALDVVLAFPQLVLILLFVSLLGHEAWLVVLLAAMVWVPGIARVTRGITLAVSKMAFTEAAEVLGIPRRRILFGEILPNLTTPLMVEFGLRLTWSIGLIAGLSFLGLGVSPPNPDWGLMINENRNGLSVQPWGVLLPVLCIAVFTVGTNLIAEGIARTMAGIDRAGDLP
jgi:peptide/nickel transport system permease protein